MHDKFAAFLPETDTFLGDRILCAVSGGIDSVVMIDLFQKSGYDIAVAHCNFQLRGEESERDENFVSVLCAQKNIPVFIKKFDTKAFSEEKKISIQEAARELRYAWFKQVCDEQQYHKIATAHHLDDTIETFFINLGRGTGIDGLTGIPVVNGNIIRPLMNCTREEIETYAQENGITFVEDSSNKEDTYTRNAIRHHIIPRLVEIFPAFHQTFSHTLENLQQVQQVYRKSIVRLRNELITLDPATGNDRVAMIELMGRGMDPGLFFEVLRDYHITYAQAEQMLASIGNQTGKKFITPSHTIWIDRGFFVIAPNYETLTDVLEIREEDLAEGVFLQYEFSFPDSENFTPNSLSNATEAAFDLGKLEFPLQIRLWQPGDKMMPIGMTGYKKISDILTDEKISPAVKAGMKVWVSNGEIIWLEGLRTSALVKVSEDTIQPVKVRLM